MQKLDLPASFAGWQSGDVHDHMNYGGAYRTEPADLVAQAKAEDLDLVFNLLVNKEQRVPDIEYFSPLPDKASTKDVLLMHSQEYHTSYWGHLGLLGLSDHYLIPGYAAYHLYRLGQPLSRQCGHRRSGAQTGRDGGLCPSLRCRARSRS